MRGGVGIETLKNLNETRTLLVFAKKVLLTCKEGGRGAGAGVMGIFRIFKAVVVA